MKELLLAAAVLCAALAIPIEGVKPGVDFKITASERPTVNLPMTARQRNWTDWYGNGSCVHASWVMMLRWQGHYEMAAFWRQNYSGGERIDSFETKLKAAKINFASTYEEFDVGFLEWAIRTRRGCIVTVNGGQHMVCLVEMTPTEVGILDNNAPEKVTMMPRDEFLAIWAASHSWACTPLYSPPPPILR